MKNNIVIFSALVLALVNGCAGVSHLGKTDVQEPEKLIVHSDGSMEYKGRMMNKDEVVIYPDGRGGERAAVKLLNVPIHPDFYRDTIIVEREPPAGEEPKAGD